MSNVNEKPDEANYPAHQAVSEIVSCFADFGDRMYGEDVTELSHALQCAEAASQRGARDALVIACLLHDIGHLLHNRGEDIAERGVDMRHEIIGEKFLRKFFPPEVSRPVGLHVAAKRYLCTVETGYLESLSPASQRSLGLQGGPMSDEEIARFEADPFHEDAVLVRRCDEGGKETRVKPADLDTYIPMMLRLMRHAD